MLGRGVLINPCLTAQLEGEPEEKDKRKRLEEFHQRIYDGYRATMPGERAVLFKMKELWSYLILLFENGAPHIKQIRKTQRLSQYEATVKTIFQTLPFKTPDKMQDEIF